MRGGYVGAITVEGFRGVGPSVRLPLHPGPGLTLVVGRNGSGKSSFAEGLELLLSRLGQQPAGRGCLAEAAVIGTAKPPGRGARYPCPVGELTRSANHGSV